MAATPPTPTPDFWFNVAEHLEGLIGLLSGGVATAALAVWRMAVWTTSIKAEMEKMRHESAEWKQTLLDKLNDMQEAQKERHEATQREMDQIHLDVRADREETRAHRQESREAAAQLSVRIDSALFRRD